MDRRDLLKTSLGTLAAALSATAAAAHDHAQHHTHHHAAVSAKRNAALIEASADCLKTGEACLAHCLYLLGNGEREMAACAQSVNELLATCTALMRLAGQDSRHVPALARVAADVCAACEKACREHADKHAECKACAESCATCVKACKTAAA